MIRVDIHLKEYLLPGQGKGQAGDLTSDRKFRAVSPRHFRHCRCRGRGQGYCESCSRGQRPRGFGNLHDRFPSGGLAEIRKSKEHRRRPRPVKRNQTIIITNTISYLNWRVTVSKRRGPCPNTVRITSGVAILPVARTKKAGPVPEARLPRPRIRPLLTRPDEGCLAYQRRS